MENTIPLLILLGAGVVGLACVLLRAFRAPAAVEANAVFLDALYRRLGEHLSCLPKR